MEVSSFLLLIVSLFTIVWLHVVWARYRLREWAKQQGYEILSQQLRVWRIGPFSFFGTSGGQSIFRIEVKDREGRIRSGYARVGGFFLGLVRRRVEVKWDRPLIEEMNSTYKQRE